MKIIDKEISKLVLRNTSKYTALERMLCFTVNPTEFGTDNYATRCMCYELNLRINMQPAPSIGLTGVTGSMICIQGRNYPIHCNR